MTELPTTFGKYYLSEKLATGGMAEIYLGKLIGPGGFEKQLVIKQIHPALTGQRQFVDLFVAEAKTLVTLAHGNIVPVYELGVIDDTYFIAMEYVDGPTLYRLTERMAARDVQMDPAIAAWIAARIAEGLDYAHRKGDGVIHRDLSPRNVMLSRDGEIKLVDFGIAVAHGDAADTRDKAPTGSFPYMSPEQVRRDALTGQTDLFSLGVLLWEMLVGKRLFARGEADATLDAVLHAEIAAPSSLRADVPAKLDEVVLRALARDRAERWPDAGELLAALNRYLYSLETTPGPREVAGLVAQFCPLETRRQPTHAETGHDAEHGVAPVEAGVGPRTAVIPRDAGAPQGRRSQRAKTFATHVELEQILVRAGTASDTSHDSEDDPAAATESAEQRAGEIVSRVAPPMSGPSSRALLVLAGVGSMVFGAIMLVSVLRARDRVLRADAGSVVVLPADAARLAAPTDAVTVTADVPVPDATSIDMAPEDAPRAVVVHVPHDAGAAARIAVDAPVASIVVAPATAFLNIGAVPYGEILIDGKSYGSTPRRNLALAAGHHTIVLRFAPGDSPAREQTFPIDLVAGETKALQAVFQ